MSGIGCREEPGGYIVLFAGDDAGVSIWLWIGMPTDQF